MPFIFWDDKLNIPPAVREMVEDWSRAGIDVSIYDKEDVREILCVISREYASTFREVKIPACMSDVARIALLYEFGGMYVDAHIGPFNFQKLYAITEKLANYKTVFFDRFDLHKHESDIHLINGAIISRKGSSVLRKIIDHQMANLMRQRENERRGYSAYNIYVLTGPWAISDCVLNRSPAGAFVKNEFVNDVRIEPLEVSGLGQPFKLYKHYGYRKGGLHWSELQKSETLFY